MFKQGSLLALAICTVVCDAAQTRPVSAAEAVPPAAAPPAPAAAAAAVAGPRPAATAPETLRGRALIEATYQQKRVPSMVMELEMTIIDGSRQWVRTAQSKSRQRAFGDQLQVFTFRSPADLDGSAVLTREENQGEPAQWVYLPAYHTARRIPPANKGEAYLGTDYFYEDVLDRHWDEYTIEDGGIEQVGPAKLTKVVATPSSEALRKTSAYSRTIFWIEPVRQVVVREEYFDKGGKLLKRLNNSALKQYGRHLLWDAASLENVQTGHRTTLRVTKREIEASIPDDVFTVQALKRTN